MVVLEETRTDGRKEQGRSGVSRARAVALLAILVAARRSPAAVRPHRPSAGCQPGRAVHRRLASASEGPIVTPVPGQGGLTSDGRPLIRWFVGLGTGERPNHIGVEQAVVDKFNDEHDPKDADYVAGNTDIVLSLEIYRNAVAYDTLATQIATGQRAGHHRADRHPRPAVVRRPAARPDRLHHELRRRPVGDPAGPDRRLQASTASRSASRWPSIPSFIYYNKTLFKEAGLAEPPHEVGEQYDGKDWTWETVAELAKKLTVDATGNDATSAGFDPTKIVQYGLDAQLTENDARAWSTVFGGSGSVVADDGTTAQWPDNWRTGLQFFYDGVWKDHFIPAKPAVDGMAGGNTLPVRPDRDGRRPPVVHVLRLSGRGRQAGHRLGHRGPARRARTARSPRSCTPTRSASWRRSKHPDEAFEVLTYLAAIAELDPDLGRDAGHREPAGRVLRGLDEHVRTAQDRLERRQGHARVPGRPEPRGVHAELPQGRRGQQGPRLQALDDARSRRQCRDRHARRRSCRASSTSASP